MKGEFAYDLPEVQAALTDRKNRLEAQKERDLERARSHKAPAPANTTTQGSLDLGF